MDKKSMKGKPSGAEASRAQHMRRNLRAASDGSTVCAVEKRVCAQMTGPSVTPEVRECGHVSRQFPPVPVGRLIAPAPQAAGTHEGLARHATGSGWEGPGARHHGKCWANTRNNDTLCPGL